MITVFELLMAASLIGAVDVLYFHLYRFRLYGRAESVAEELTHLARSALFIGIVAVVMLAGSEPWAMGALLTLFVADLANSIADVLLERQSRASLGGLPSGEYLLHILGTLFTGITVATMWWRHDQPASFTNLQMARGWVTIGIGVILFAAEASLFVMAWARRGQPAPAPST